MKIKILTVGTLKEKYLKEACNEYIKRLNKYTKVEIIEVKDEDDTKSNAKELEANKLLKYIKNNAYVVALALRAKEYTSEELASWLNKTFIKANSEIVFVIGGSLGLASSILKRANECLSLSHLTFTHQMSRIILLEQIYRSFKINSHEKYHK